MRSVRKTGFLWVTLSALLLLAHMLIPHAHGGGSQVEGGHGLCNHESARHESDGLSVVLDWVHDWVHHHESTWACPHLDDQFRVPATATEADADATQDHGAACPFAGMDLTAVEGAPSSHLNGPPGTCVGQGSLLQSGRAPPQEKLDALRFS